jgi:hypothetical protein
MHQVVQRCPKVVQEGSVEKHHLSTCGYPCVNPWAYGTSSCSRTLRALNFSRSLPRATDAKKCYGGYAVDVSWSYRLQFQEVPISNWNTPQPKKLPPICSLHTLVYHGISVIHFILAIHNALCDPALHDLFDFEPPPEVVSLKQQVVSSTACRWNLHLEKQLICRYFRYANLLGLLSRACIIT